MNMQVKGTKLLIEIDVSEAALKNAPLSSTGKSRVVASTSGFKPVAGSPVRVGLNVITRD
jgi:hypothetical protein